MNMFETLLLIKCVIKALQLSLDLSFMELCFTADDIASAVLLILIIRFIDRGSKRLMPRQLSQLSPEFLSHEDSYGSFHIRPQYDRIFVTCYLFLIVSMATIISKSFPPVRRFLYAYFLLFLFNRVYIFTISVLFLTEFLLHVRACRHEYYLVSALNRS
jgi:hypothetical protein